MVDNYNVQDVMNNRQTIMERQGGFSGNQMNAQMSSMMNSVNS